MASLKETKQRISSIKSTEQITRAMKMVSAAKLKKAQTQILNLRSYAKGLLQVLTDIAYTKKVKHPLLLKSLKKSKSLLVVLTSDRGLCGGFNNNICRFAQKYYNENQDKKNIDFFFIGKRGADFFKFRNIQSPHKVLLNLTKEISYDLAAKVSKVLYKLFLKGEYDSITIIYNEFKSVIAQEIVAEQFLPLNLSKSSFEKTQSPFAKDLIFEVPPEEMIEELIKKQFAIQTYRALCESVAAEHGARMTAMENATKNAKEITESLTLMYNKMRQSSITTELMEITSGAEAMKA